MIPLTPAPDLIHGKGLGRSLLQEQIVFFGGRVAHDIPIGSTQISLALLNDRSREIFRQIVENYLATGEPVGSRNISRIIPMTLSPASVRNVM